MHREADLWLFIGLVSRIMHAYDVIVFQECDWRSTEYYNKRHNMKLSYSFNKCMVNLYVMKNESYIVS